jgi:hypothetical protein
VNANIHPKAIQRQAEVNPSACQQLFGTQPRFRILAHSKVFRNPKSEIRIKTEQAFEEYFDRSMIPSLLPGGWNVRSKAILTGVGQLLFATPQSVTPVNFIRFKAFHGKTAPRRTEFVQIMNRFCLSAQCSRNIPAAIAYPNA